MANPDPSSLMQMAMRHGFWAVGCLVVGTAFYSFALVPLASDREVFVKTLQTTATKNATSMEQMAETGKQIRLLIKAQEVTMKGIRMELKRQSEMRVIAMETMTAFTEKVSGERTNRDILLNKLIEVCGKPREEPEQ
jgi:hypothetical protein